MKRWQVKLAKQRKNSSPDALPVQSKIQANTELLQFVGDIVLLILGAEVLLLQLEAERVLHTSHYCRLDSVSLR